MKKARLLPCPDSREPAIQASGLKKSYSSDERLVLDDASLILNYGTMGSLVGASGSGKTTLLNILGLLDKCDAGELYVASHPTHQMRPGERRHMRARNLGFVFQESLLDPKLTVSENIELGLRYSGVHRSRRRELALDAAERTGIHHKHDASAGSLSGGERQRAAIARALAHSPSVLLCDEPTGALDEDNTVRIVQLLKDIAASGTAVLVVTHDLNVSACCQAQHRIERGKVSECSA